MISCDLAMALSFFNKWKNESSSIHILCSADTGPRTLGLSVNLVGVVDRVEPNLLVRVTGPKAEFMLDLTSGVFKYGEPGEAPEAIREEMEFKFVSLLEARFPSGLLCLFFELANSPLESFFDN